jgi:DHA2 family methylenomycin A resistance protein-like MFS transporter
LPGQVTAIIALTALAGATIEAGSAGSRLALVYEGYALAAAAAFIAIEHARERPMLPLSLFRMRAFSTAVSAGLLVSLVFFGLIFAFSLFLQRQQGLSPLATGLAFLPVTALIVVSNLVAGRLVPARGPRAVARAGALLMGAGCLTMLGLGVALFGTLLAGLRPSAGLEVTFAIGAGLIAVVAALGHATA